MAYKGNNGEYGVGYIAPSPPIGDEESGYKYFPGGPLKVDIPIIYLDRPISSENKESEVVKLKCLKHFDETIKCSKNCADGSNYCNEHNPYRRNRKMGEKNLEIPLVVPYVPDPKKHLYVSIAKSVLRFFGYGLMLFSGNTYVICAAIPLILAEVMGIVEELV